MIQNSCDEGSVNLHSTLGAKFLATEATNAVFSDNVSVSFAVFVFAHFYRVLGAGCGTFTAAAAFTEVDARLRRENLAPFARCEVG